nr:AmmeMemoRadiSam system protein A [uncultured Selenomonas sp.]
MSILATYSVPHPPLIIPAIGTGREREIAATVQAYHDVMCAAAELRPDTVVIISPHATAYDDFFHISPGTGAEGNFAAFGHSEVSVGIAYDEEFVRVLSALAGEKEIPAGTLGEKHPSLDHGTMIPLFFLSTYLGDAPTKFVRIGVSGLPAHTHTLLGQLIAATAERLGRRTVCIASGDLSHRLMEGGANGFAPEGAEFDELCASFLKTGDFLSLLQIPGSFAEAAGHCGLNGLWVLAGALDRAAMDAVLHSYEAPFGVGYAVASFTVTGRNEANDFAAQLVRAEDRAIAELRAAEDDYVRLARLSIEHYVRTHRFAVMPSDLPRVLMERRAGTFVSIKKYGKLRGCIGTFAPAQKTLGEEIFYNAVSAAVHDGRFEPIEEGELNRLVYSVDVLSVPEPIESAAQLDPKIYGVIVKSLTDQRRGLLLPDLAGIDTAEDQIAIAREKARIQPKEPIALTRFTVERHH